MNKATQKVLVFVIGSLISEILLTLAKNKIDGRTIFGNKTREKKQTRTDWKGNIWLGSEDYKIA